MPATIQLPPEIEIQRLAGGDVRYVLPKRPVSRRNGVALIGMAALLCAVALDGFWFAQIHFGWLGLVLTGPALGAGLAILCGRAVIELRDGVLLCSERVGPFHWTRRHAVANIRRLFVDSWSPQQRLGTISKSALFVLKVECTRERPHSVTFGYPRDWLLALGEQLAGDCAAAAAVRSIGVPTPIVVVDIPLEESPDFDRAEQPPRSNVVCQPLRDGLTLKVSPRGIWRSSAGLFTTSLIVCGFMLVLTISLIVSIVQQWGRVPTNGLPVLVAVLSLFWTIGLGMMLAAINTGRRRAAIAVAGSALMVIQAGIFGTKRHQWQQAEVKTVQVGPSGASDGEKPIMQLQIVPREGKPFTMLTGRDLAELQWMATLLRQALQPTCDLGGQSSPSSTAQV